MVEIKSLVEATVWGQVISTLIANTRSNSDQQLKTNADIADRVVAILQERMPKPCCPEEQCCGKPEACEKIDEIVGFDEDSYVEPEAAVQEDDE